uniref:EF-hand domain-containing protein n=1 Tax=Mus spicilegus TaxID=10103 RepID=A0A8C6HHA4_MUSSI
MAGPQQQPPYLHLAELTASQFLEIWKHFDADGNGYIEGKELENFFQELEKARKGSGMMSKSDNFGEKMKEFMQKYDKNSDGKIEMAELAQILPTEENFLLCFRQHVGSSAEFMEVSLLSAHGDLPSSCIQRRPALTPGRESLGDARPHRALLVEVCGLCSRGITWVIVETLQH